MSAASSAGRLRAREQPPHRPAGAPGTQCGRHVLRPAVVAGVEMPAHRAEIGAVALAVPGRRDGFGDQRRLDVVDRPPAPAHAPDDAREHGEALFPVIAVMPGGAGVDHGEGVEAGRILAEGDEGAAERFRRVLERAPVVDHHGLAAGADDAGHQLLHQHRLARAGLAGDGDVVVAGGVGEGRPAGRLAAPSDQEQGGRGVGRRRLAAPLAVHRREVDRGGRQQGLHPSHAGKIGVETAGRHHGQAGEPGRELHVALGVHPPALAVIDRAHRLLGLVDGLRRRVDRRHVAGAHQALAVLEPLGDRLPVSGLLGQARQVARKAGAGLLGRPGGFEEGALAVGGLAGHHGERRQHRAAGLEEVAVKVADERVTAPARPHFGEGDRRQHPHRHVARAGAGAGPVAGAAVGAPIGVVETPAPPA